jgi:anthranilate phosphoribosyltransferase
VVQGMEGSEDVSVSKRTRTLVVSDGAYEPYLVDPEALGVQAETPELEWTPERQLQTTLAVLKGEAELPYRNTVLLNSALRLWVTGHARTVEEGLAAAAAALDQGLAWRQFAKWKDAVLSAQTTAPSEA